MKRSFVQYAKLLFKLFVHGGTFGGRKEFQFKLMLPEPDRYRITVKARDSGFQATLFLRRDTSDLSAFEQVFAENAYNMRHLRQWDEIKKVYTSLSRAGMPLILDLGANIGLASLYFAKNWPGAKIVAVEPEPQNYRVMCENLAPFERVQPVHAAVASADSAVRILNPSDEAWATRTELAPAETGDSIRALSVQTLLGMAPPTSVPFIAKIDIEGFEKELFSGNTDWVKLFPIVIMELHDWMLPGEAAARRFLEVVSKQDRDFLILNENIVCVSNEGTTGMLVPEG